jgi:hypothetical protein
VRRAGEIFPRLPKNEAGAAICSANDGYWGKFLVCLTAGGTGVRFGLEVGQSDMGDRPVHISCSEGKMVQSIAIRALAPEMLAPSFDKNARVRPQVVLDFSFCRRAKKFQRDDGTHTQ